jgi:hypothetical protein
MGSDKRGRRRLGGFWIMGATMSGGPRSRLMKSMRYADRRAAAFDADQRRVDLVVAARLAR